jgi:hypothetical protein
MTALWHRIFFFGSKFRFNLQFWFGPPPRPTFLHNAKVWHHVFRYRGSVQWRTLSYLGPVCAKTNCYVIHFTLFILSTRLYQPTCWVSAPVCFVNEQYCQQTNRSCMSLQKTYFDTAIVMFVHLLIFTRIWLRCGKQSISMRSCSFCPQGIA